jgi:hypothetical protein
LAVVVVFVVFGFSDGLLFHVASGKPMDILLIILFDVLIGFNSRRKKKNLTERIGHFLMSGWTLSFILF